MKSEMTIGKVAKTVGLPASTIRYYESIGVVRKPARKNGIRHYDTGIIDELKALRFYRAVGIPMRALTALGAVPRGSRERSDVWSRVLHERIDDLNAWVREAKKTKALIERAVACNCNGKRDRCAVLLAADDLR